MQELLFIKLGSPGGRLASYKDPEVLALYLRHCLSFLRSSSPSSCAGFNVRQALPEWWSSYISSAKLLQKSDDSTEPGSVARGCSTLTDQIWACAHPRSPLGVPLEPHGLWVCVCGGGISQTWSSALSPKCRRGRDRQFNRWLIICNWSGAFVCPRLWLLHLVCTPLPWSFGFMSLYSRIYWGDAQKLSHFARTIEW